MYVVAWSFTRWQFVRKLVASTPQVMLWDGEIDTAGCGRQGSRGPKCRPYALRGRGLRDVAAVVLETNGTLSDY